MQFIVVTKREKNYCGLYKAIITIRNTCLNFAIANLNYFIRSLNEFYHFSENIDFSCRQMRHLETEVDQLKRDYVFLMQSSLRINNSDGPETMEVYHYGGNRVYKDCFYNSREKRSWHF